MSIDCPRIPLPFLFLSDCNTLKPSIFSSSLSTVLSNFVYVIPITGMIILNASLLDSSILESKLFTFSCPKCMSLSLNTFHASLWDGIKGRLSSEKDNSISLLWSIQNVTLWNGKFSHLLQLLHILL